MKKEEKESLIEFFGKTLNITAEDVAPIFEEKGDDHELKTDAVKTLLKFDADRVAKLKGDVAKVEKDQFDKGYKKAQAEILPKLEKQVKEKYSIDSDKQGLDLFEEIITLKTKTPELEVDKVKAHPEYMKLEKEADKKLKEAEAVWTKKIEDREKEIAREKTLSTVKKAAMAELKKLDPIFGTTDENKINNQIDHLLMKGLEQFEFVIQNDEMVAMKDGKRLEDAHGKPITYSELIKTEASKHWDFGDGKERSGSGANNDDAAGAGSKGAAGKKYKGQLPKSEEEFNQKFATEKDPEQRVALMEEFEASKTATV